jgi:hypothetical protein
MKKCPTLFDELSESLFPTSTLVGLLSFRCLINSGNARGPRRTNWRICGDTLGGANCPNPFRVGIPKRTPLSQ